MSGIYVSTYCVDFRDYDHLRTIINDLKEYDVGVEFATSWITADFDDLLEAQIGRFDDVPVTLHAPFGESCCAPGSEAYTLMERKFQKAFRWYHAFHAGSMVMHTHKRKVAREEKRSLCALAESVILNMAHRAREEGISLTVENVGFRNKGSELYDQTEFIRLFDRLPEEVGALIDTGHAIVNGWDIPLVIRSLGPRIKGLHLHNNDGNEDDHLPLFTPGLACSPGEMEEIIRSVKDYCPDADLILEYAPGTHITTELFRRDVERILEL